MQSKQKFVALPTLRKKQLGAASIVDFTLTLPIFVAALLVIVQIAMIAHAALVVRHAAFAAARSAKVHITDSDHAFRELDCCGGAFQKWAVAEHANTIARLAGNNSGGWRDYAEAAAMRTLVSISPGRKDFTDNAQPQQERWNEQSMSRYYDVVTTQHRARFSNRNAVLLRKAKYSHDSANTTVSIAIVDIKNARGALSSLNDPSKLFESLDSLIDVYSAASYISRNENTFVSVPISVTVEFRFPLQIPFAAILFNNAKKNNKPQSPYARIIKVTVDLS